MSKYAYLVDGVVDHISLEPQGVSYVEVPDDVFGGFILQADGTFINPDTPEPVSPYLPLDPAPFWLGALHLLQLTQEDVLNALPEGVEREEARIAIRDRKQYLRHDPMVDGLALQNNIPPEQMDSLWLYVQENFK